MRQAHWSESFLPVQMLLRLRASGERRPAAIEFSGAVIFVDVARYTTLVEQLVQQGPEGLERIPEILGRYWSRSVEAIHDLGGEALLFAGDALVGYWAAEAGGIGAAVDTAVACAERICQVESRRGVDRHEPFLHVGIGAGTLNAAAIGGFARRWNLLVCGDAIRDAALALAEAPARTYRLGERALALRGSSAPPGRPPGSLSPGIGSGELEWFCQFLPRAFDGLLEAERLVEPGADASRQIEQSLASLSELRHVTTLFAKFEGLDVAPSRALDRYHSLCMSLQAVMHQHEGPSGQLLFDDKGLVFHAAFGTPGSYHRDDALRAVSAALELRTVASRHGLGCAIGLATGAGYFTAVGPRQRRELMLVGAPNNRASRLMGLAEGAVLCDGATRHACGAAVRFEQAGAVQLTGLGQVQETHRALALQDRAASRLIGRARELSLLREAFDAARAGASRLVFVVGNAGIGKSFLVRSLLEQVRGEASAMVIARSQDGEQQSAFLAWRRVLAQLVGLPAEPPGEALLVRLRAAVPDPDGALGQRWPLLAGLLGTDIDDTPATASLSAASRADASMRFVADLVRQLSRPVTLFVLEDAHWLDSSSWRLAAWLPPLLESALTVVCLRGDEPCPEYHALLERMNSSPPASSRGGPSAAADASVVDGRVLELFELDESAVHDLASRVLDDEPVSSALGHRLWAVSRGNPLLAEEVLLSLRADGLVSLRDGRWRAVDGLDHLDRLRGIERIIIERLDRLGPTEKLVLKLASVVGTRFHADELRALISGSELGAPLDGVLAALRARHLVEPAGEDGEWQFRHDRTREVIYDGLPGTLRRELHLAVATCLEQHADWGPRRRADVLARHFHAAGVVQKALLWADRAAGDAIESGAFKEAVTLLHICLEHEGQLAGPNALLERVRWRRQLAAACLRLGDLEQVKSTVESALALSGRAAARGWLSRGWLASRGRLAHAASKLAARELMPAPTVVLEPSPEKAWALELARTHMLENMSRYYEHDLLGCAEAVFAAADWAERAGPSGELVEAYSLLGGIVGLMHGQRLATRFFRRASAVAALLGDKGREAAALMTQGLYHVSMGHWADAEMCLDASQERATSVGDSLTWCHAQQVRFWLMHYQGQRGMAEETARQLFARAQNSGNLQQEIWALRNKALCALARDSPQLARDYLRLALKTVRGRADKSELLQSTGCLALAYARSGERAQALEAARTTIDYLTSVRRPTVHSALEATSAVVEVYLRGHDLRGHEQPPKQADALSRQYVEKGLAALERHAKTFPTGQPRLALWRGLEASLAGKSRLAIELWEKGLTRAHQLGMRGDVALLEAELRSRRS